LTQTLEQALAQQMSTLKAFIEDLLMEKLSHRPRPILHVNIPRSSEPFEEVLDMPRADLNLNTPINSSTPLEGEFQVVRSRKRKKNNSAQRAEQDRMFPPLSATSAASAQSWGSMFTHNRTLDVPYAEAAAT